MSNPLQSFVAPANKLMTVQLEAQAWNVVIAGLRKLPYEVVEFVYPAVSEQLQQQANAIAPGNGLDASEARHDGV